MDGRPSHATGPPPHPPADPLTDRPADDFYARLPPVARFADLVRDDVYASVPADWTVIVADVEGSTEAVDAGRFRDVNYVGAGAIAAVLNATAGAVGVAEVPFVFGGDGATLLVPPATRALALGALMALQGHAEARLGLRLRVGAVGVADARAAGHDVLLARLEVAPGYAQALLDGTGIAWAEDEVKTHPDRYAPRPDETAVPPDAEALLAGLECRWHDVASPHGETVALLVQAVGDDPAGVYADALAAIERLYGLDAHPVDASALRLRAVPATTAEALLRAPAPRQRLALVAQGLVGRALLAARVTTSETDWAAYPHRLRAATDYRKFDGTLRMVLAGRPEQRAALEAWLEASHRAGRLAWGTHAADAAVLTCLVYERMGRQVHFVDAAGGGYTRAAVGLKARLKALA